MFLDEFTLQARGGDGGDGCVHFAHIKYQPFAGPDGGDGGDGGTLYLLGTRAVESLDHLRRSFYQATPGAPGGGNRMIGANGSDAEIPAPPGTLVYDERTGQELGMVAATGERVILARGGKGGKGNPHFASGRQRTPRTAQRGTAAESRQVLLRYRIYCGTALLEPALPHPAALLPRLLDRAPEEVDWTLYQRKPRWVRVEHEFQRFDAAYLALDAAFDGELSAPYLEHLYWAEHAFLNLLPLEENAQAGLDSLWPQLTSQPLRRLSRLEVCASVPLTVPAALESDAGAVEIATTQAEAGDLVRLFTVQLRGGTVD